MGELNEIISHLQGVLGPLSGAPVELHGGITNRNFRVTLGGHEYVLRRPGGHTELLGIDRESERLASEAAAALGIAPPVAAAFGDCLVTRYVASSPLHAGAEAAGAQAAGTRAGALADSVEEIAAALRRFHDSPTSLPTRFSVPNLLASYAAIVHERGGALPGDFTQAQAAAARIAAALPIGPGRPCHNDLLAANFILSAEDGRLLIVDWEYAGMGDPRFDLGNLSVNNRFEEPTDERLLAAYHGRAPTPGERAAHALMRVLSDAREGAWGIVQAHISQLDFDFQGYAGEHFARMNAAVRSPRFERWLASAREPASAHDPPTAHEPAGAQDPPTSHAPATQAKEASGQAA